MGVVRTVDGVHLQGLIHADSLVGAPGLSVPAGTRHHALNAHQRGERPGAEIRAGRGSNPGVDEGTVGHAPLHEFFAVEVELVGVVVRIRGERRRHRAERLDAPHEIIVDQRAVSDLGAHVGTRRQPAAPARTR